MHNVLASKHIHLSTCTFKNNWMRSKKVRWEKISSFACSCEVHFSSHPLTNRKFSACLIQHTVRSGFSFCSPLNLAFSSTSSSFPRGLKTDESSDENFFISMKISLKSSCTSSAYSLPLPSPHTVGGKLNLKHADEVKFSSHERKSVLERTKKSIKLMVCGVNFCLRKEILKYVDCRNYVYEMFCGFWKMVKTEAKFSCLFMKYFESINFKAGVLILGCFITKIKLWFQNILSICSFSSWFSMMIQMFKTPKGRDGKLWKILDLKQL